MSWIEQIPDLFKKVQLESVFKDQKTFVDCNPKFSIDEIIADYNLKSIKDNFNLSDFIIENFELPSDSIKVHSCLNDEGVKKDIIQHINDLWEELSISQSEDNGTLIGLPNRYILPGGRFREIYYWDSYFTMQGLMISNRMDIVNNMIENFSFLIQKFGFIPNGNRTYYLSRSQPPFFSLMIQLQLSNNDSIIKPSLGFALRKEYDFWMDGSNDLNENTHKRIVRMPNGTLLNRYYDELKEPRPESYLQDYELQRNSNNNVYRNIRAACESGWDFSSRWFDENLNLESINTTQIVPIDLNCLLLNTELVLAKFYQQNGQIEEKNNFDAKAESRKYAIQHYFWNKQLNFYCDYNIQKNEICNQPTLAGLFPLFFNIANQIQAENVLNKIESIFLFKGGLVTTIVESKQQWDFPNAWAPLQFIGFQSSMNYNKRELATKIATYWCQNVERVYNNTGKLMEKYNAVNTNLFAGGGEYPTQDGFGWTNGVYLFFKHILSN